MCIDAAGGWSPSGRISRWLWLFCHPQLTHHFSCHLSLSLPRMHSREMTGDERATNFSTEGDREIERVVCFPCGRPLVRQASIVFSGVSVASQKSRPQKLITGCRAARLRPAASQRKFATAGSFFASNYFGAKNSSIPNVKPRRAEQVSKQPPILVFCGIFHSRLIKLLHFI